MRLKYKLLTLFFLLITSWTFSQNSTVIVKAPSYEGKDIYIWIEDDLFTRHLNLIDQGVVADSLFMFSFQQAEIAKIRIAIDFQYGSLFVEPGSNYTILFPERDKELNRSLAWNTQVFLTIIGSPTHDINQVVSNFNSDLDVFFSNLFYEVDNKQDSSEAKIIKAFSTRESLIAFNAFKETWDSLYFENDSPYFKDYRQYSAASIAHSLGEKKDLLFQNYLEGQKVLYNNPEYISFFHTFYQNYFDFYRFYPLDQKLKKALSSKEAPVALAELVAEDSQTGDKRSQELVLMKGMFDLQIKNPYLDSIAFRVMEYVETTSNFRENRIVASHFLENIKRGKIGAYFPDFECISSFNDTLLFSSYADEKLIYVQIFASWSSSSIGELELMKELYKRYNSKVKFISVSIDPQKEDFDSFYSKNRKYKWDFVWIGQHPDILEHLSIYDVPLFYLLEGDMTIEKWPALAPSTGIEQTFYELELKERENKKFRFWEDQTNKSNKER